MKIFTLSLDDGLPEDISAFKIMLKHEVRGTFYPNYSRIHDWHKEIHQKFEVGSHGLTHDNPLKMNPKKLKEFVKKAPFEDFLKKEIKVFAYPWGFHNNEVISAVKNEGYIGSRIGGPADKTHSFPKDPFRMPPTMYVGAIPPFEKFKLSFDNFLKLKDGVFHMATHAKSLQEFDEICKYIKNSGIKTLTNSELILEEKNASI